MDLMSNLLACLSTIQKLELFLQMLSKLDLEPQARSLIKIVTILNQPLKNSMPTVLGTLEVVAKAQACVNHDPLYQLKQQVYAYHLNSILMTIMIAQAVLFSMIIFIKVQEQACILIATPK
jgi:hypothetical protein